MIRSKVSLADQIYQRIEKNIIQGEYAREEVLSENEIADKLGVSRTPVREALNRLEQDHMVESTGKGVRIIGISPKDIMTMYDARVALEGMCVRETAENITEEELNQLKDIVEYAEYCLEKNGDAEKIRDCDDQFHDLIYTASKNQVLYNILIPLHKKVSKYRRINLTDPVRAGKSCKEHRQIYEALKKGDLDQAEKVAVAHVEKAKNHMVKKMKQQGQN